MEGIKECEFGAKCYRQNPKHFEEFSHPVEVDKPKVETIRKRRRKDDSPKKLLKQTRLDFFQRVVPGRPQDAKQEDGHPKTASPALPQQRRSANRKRKPTPLAKSVVEESSESEGEGSGVCDVTSNSWVFQGNSSDKKQDASPEKEYNKQGNLTSAEKIKKLFLVEMPEDFYKFYEFCQTLDSKKPTEALGYFGLRLVGPYDVLNGCLSPGSVSSEKALTHWRFFMDPPEFQTVLVAEKGLHFGYWRDEPQAKDTFLVSNTVPDCKIKTEAPTIFGTVLHYLENHARQCNPFDKVKTNSIAANLKQYAENQGIDLSSSNEVMNQRKTNVVARTFNDMGIVVPYDKKTEVGYRPLLETNANLKKLCQAAIKAKNPNTMDEIERLVNAANIANDECDFGNGLELGIDLFCMGSEIFDSFVEHLLTTAYSLLNRPEWGEVIKAHLKNRRTGLELSVINS